MKKTKKKTPTEHHPVVAGFLNTLKTEFEPWRSERREMSPMGDKRLAPRKVLVDADVLDALFVRLQELEIAVSKTINTLEIAHKCPDTLRLKKFVRWSEREQKP